MLNTMGPSEIEQCLRSCGLFRQLDAPQCAQLAGIAVVEQYSANQRIFSAGDPCPGVYVVRQGMVQIFQSAPNGKVHVLHFAERGQSFAEVAAIGGFNCPGSAEALADTVCVRLPLNPFRDLLDSDHALCRQMLTGMSLWVRQLVGLLEDLVLRDAAGRLAQYLLDSYQENDERAIHLSMKRKDLALHLNLSGETLSRTFRRLEECGLVTQDGDNQVQISNPAGLQSVADGAPPSESA